MVGTPGPAGRELKTPACWHRRTGFPAREPMRRNERPGQKRPGSISRTGPDPIDRHPREGVER